MTNIDFTKYIGIVLGFILSIFDAQAQAPSSLTVPGKKKFISTIEFFGGPAIANQYGKTKSDDQVINATYTLGVGISHRLYRRFDIIGRLSFQRKGTRIRYSSVFIDENSNATPIKVTVAGKYDYATLELLGRYYIDNADKLFCGFGGYISNLQKAKSSSQAKNLQGETVYTYYLEEHSIRNFDYGLTATVGYNLRVRPKLVLQSQIVGNLGFSDIVKKEVPNQGPVKIYFIALTVGMNLNP